MWVYFDVTDDVVEVRAISKSTLGWLSMYADIIWFFDIGVPDAEAVWEKGLRYKPALESACVLAMAIFVQKFRVKV